jgi:hypothetical protein
MQESEKALNFIKRHDWDAITVDFEALLASVVKERPKRILHAIPCFSSMAVAYSWNKLPSSTTTSQRILNQSEFDTKLTRKCLKK